ncbi:MAG: internal scaffolding protein [Arizlama microvirus]|nr:MAG: internal scaffolding protein [Arizlama microvirus]
MSKEFAQKFHGKKFKREDVRKFTDFHTPLGPDGRPVYVTEQGHKDECDVNNIIKKYDSTGLLTHVAKFEAVFADVGSVDFKEALDRQIEIGNRFMELPSEIRKTFENNPVNYLSFLEKPENYAKSVEMGLRKAPDPSQIHPEASKLQKAGQTPPEIK